MLHYDMSRSSQPALTLLHRSSPMHGGGGVQIKEPDLVGSQVELFTTPLILTTMCMRSLTTQSPSNWSDSSPSSPRSLVAGTSVSQSPSGAGTAAHACAVGSIRKRVVRACEVCRRKKVKCNGQKPCSHCISFAEECIYVDVKDRSAYSRRYVESLELRLAKLEHAWSMMLQHRCHPNCRRALSPAGAPDGHALDSRPKCKTASASAQLAASGRTESDTVALPMLSATHLIAQACATLQALQPSRQLALQTVQSKTKDEAPHALTLLPLPEGAKFYALLECYAHRVHLFFPAVSLAEAQSAWERVSSSSPLPSVLDAETVALVYAIMSCASQAVIPANVAENFNTYGSSTQYDAQARLWTSFFAKPSTPSTRQLHGLQAMVLLAYAAAARGEAENARRHLDHVHSLASAVAQPSCDENQQGVAGVLRLLPVLQMLVDGLQSGIGPVEHLPSQTAASCSSPADLAGELAELASLCSTTGSVGRTIVELLSSPPGETAAKQRAVEQESLLESWYDRLPLSFRSSPGAQSEPISAAASCIAFVSLQHSRLRLHLALLHSQDQAGGEEDATRCMQLAMHTLRASDTVLRFLPPTPWLALHLQCYAMAAAFVLKRVLNEPPSAAARIVAEVEATLTGIRRSTDIMDGAKEVVDDLQSLSSHVRAAFQIALDQDRNRSAYMQVVDESTAKRVRTEQSDATNPTADAVEACMPAHASTHATINASLDSPPHSWPSNAVVQVDALTLTQLWPSSTLPALGVAQQATPTSTNDVGACSSQAQADLVAGLLEGLIGHHQQLRPASL